MLINDSGFYMGVIMVGMRKRNLGTVDLDTGERIDKVFAIAKTKFNPWSEGYIMTARYGSKFLARDKSITGVAQRVLRELESQLDYENWVKLALVDIAKDLCIDRSQVSRAIKILVDKGLVLKGSKIGHFYNYRLNPQFCWRGDSRKQPSTLCEIPSSEYTDFRRACLAEDAEKKRANEGLEPLSGSQNVIDFQQQQKRRKRATQLAEKILSSNVDFDALDEFLKKNGTK